MTGQGWRLFVREAGPDAAILAGDLPDGGAVLGWLEARGVGAVLVRPDHYVFGTGSAADLLAARDALLGTKQEIAA